VETTRNRAAVHGPVDFSRGEIVLAGLLFPRGMR
jgi:hypothetical protein